MGHKVKQSLMSSRIDFFYYAFRNILIVGIPLVIISALILGFCVPHSSAEVSGSTDDVSLTLSTSCTVNAVVTIAHETSLHGGQKDDNVGNTKLSAYCNDNNGYSIYAVGSSGDIDGNTDLINAVNESYNIHTGVYDNTVQTNPSSWAMKLTAGTGTGIDPVTGESVPTTPPTIINGYDNYSAIPNVYTQVAKRTSGTSMITDSDASGSYLNTTYQIYANSYQPAGTYNGKVKYVIVHPNSSNNNLSFNEAYALNGKNPAIIDGANVYYAMQDMNSQICNMVANTGAITATQLVDTRDNKLYWVAKLEDGHCWMTQNLDFNIDSTKTYTHDDTDLGWDPNSFDSNATWKPDTTNGKYNLPVNGTSVPGWSNQNNYPYSADPGDVYYYTSNSASDDIKYTSLSNCTSAGHTEGECKHYHAGNYYNWTAAIASNNSSSLTTQYANAPNSICPKGWRLPIATNADQSIYEFGEMLYRQGITAQKIGSPVDYTANGFNNIRKAPLWFIRAGMIADGAVRNGAIMSLYSSNTVFDYDSDYVLNIDKNSVYPSTYYDGWYSKSGGKSVRCLAR